MDIQVTIKISREALGEATSVLREFLAQVPAQVPEAEVSVDKPKASVPYGQQIAEHFPQANTAVPAAQAPVSRATPPPVSVTPTVQAPVPQPSPVPTAEHTYTAEELQVAAVALVDKGMMVQLQGLLQQFGVNSLPELPVEKYGAFATALRGMGAQI